MTESTGECPTGDGTATRQASARTTGHRPTAAETRMINVSPMAAALLGRGWQVDRAEGPGCAGNLVAERGQVLLRVAVRSASERTPGRLTANLDGLQPGQCDLLALVAGRSEVILLPDPDGHADTRALAARLTPVAPRRSAACCPRPLPRRRACERRSGRRGTDAHRRR